MITTMTIIIILSFSFAKSDFVVVFSGNGVVVVSSGFIVSAVGLNCDLQSLKSFRLFNLRTSLVFSEYQLLPQRGGLIQKKVSCISLISAGASFTYSNT